MLSFSRIKISGFRRLHEVELELRPWMVLIGANSVGKTSFLDAWALLAASAAEKLNDNLRDLNGIQSIVTNGRTDKLHFELSMPADKLPPLDYFLTVARQGAASYAIEREKLSQQKYKEGNPFCHIDSKGPDIKYYEVDQRRLVRPNWEHNPFETSLAQVPKMFLQPDEFKRRLSSSTLYHTLDVGLRAPVRQPQPLRPAAYPGANGEDLISCLYTLRESERNRYEAIEDALRVAFPGFERLDFPPVAAGTLSMTWKDARFPHPFYPHQLSEGCLRFLWLITLLQSRELTAVTMIDEPEVSLHPELLSLLSDLMREASQRTQLIVATHSDRLVTFLKPEEVVVFDMTEDGLAKLTWGDDLDLGCWLEDYTLGEIWAKIGQMGGRS